MRPAQEQLDRRFSDLFFSLMQCFHWFVASLHEGTESNFRAGEHDGVYVWELLLGLGDDALQNWRNERGKDAEPGSRGRVRSLLAALIVASY